MKNKIISIAVAVLAAVSMCACSDGGTDAKPQAAEFETVIMGELVQADSGTVLEAQAPVAVKAGGKKVETAAFVIEDRYADQYYGGAVAVKTNAVLFKGQQVVLDIEYFVKDDICIPTPYGILHFSDEWADYLELEITDDGNTYLFRYINDKEILDLFTISFGVQGDIVAGTLDGGKTPVLVSIADNSGSKTNAVFAMAEGVNYLLQHITELQGFETVQ